MSAAGSDDAATLQAMIAGYEAAQAIYVAAKLDLADLAARGTTSSRALADATGSDETALHRILRALASLGVLADVGNHRFELTERGRSCGPRAL
jgi:DNA-binding IclR family transcriptional regulator